MRHLLPPSSGRPLSRRGALKISAVTAAAACATLPFARAADDVASSVAGRKRTVRFAHFTDIHLQPERGAVGGLAAYLRHAQSLKEPPEFILTGGDGVMDAFDVGADRAELQADLWRRVWRAECSLPSSTALATTTSGAGAARASARAGDEPNWGKQWALDLYGLKSRYRSFDRAGWHFVILDSIFPTPDNKESKYTAKLDDDGTFEVQYVKYGWKVVNG